MHQGALVWLRRDLRLYDHAALSAATTESRTVAVVFVLDRTILDRLTDADDRRVTYIMESLREVDRELRERGSQLILRSGDPAVEIPRLAAELGASSVYANRDYEPAALLRDRRVSEALAAEGRQLQLYRDQVIYEPHEIRNQQGYPYRVFTQYKNTWLRTLAEDRTQEYRVDLRPLMPATVLANCSLALDYSSTGFVQASELAVGAGCTLARQTLANFVAERLHFYHEARDIPSRDGTSGVSVHLRFGTLSIREIFRALTPLLPGSPGAETFRNELIWREFFQMILGAFPHVVDGAFQRQYSHIDWPGLDAHFEVWCAGRTGYPLVDAAMRCLRATGTMHNRLRMVVASFLVKDLLIDWRRGEAWFARWLLDFDLAANNGGWQWCASTGCDAQPYFRIFNPVAQSRRFDPEGQYIRRWLPELSTIPSAHIHWPWDHPTARQHALSVGYPEPAVDHATQRLRALELYRKSR